MVLWKHAGYGLPVVEYMHWLCEKEQSAEQEQAQAQKQMYYALHFVNVKHSVCHQLFSLFINTFMVLA